MKTKQPDRGPEDGPIGITRLDDETLAIDCTTNGVLRRTIASEYNAWRLFGTLAVFLGIQLPKKLEKSIDLGGGKPCGMQWEVPPELAMQPELLERFRAALQEEVEKSGLEGAVTIEKRGDL